MFRKLPPDYISLTINSGAFKLGLIVSHKIIGGFFPECEGLSTMHFSLLSKKKNHKTFLIKQRNPISFIKFIIWHCILCLIKVPLNGKGRGRRIGSPVNLIRIDVFSRSNLRGLSFISSLEGAKGRIISK